MKIPSVEDPETDLNQVVAMMSYAHIYYRKKQEKLKQNIEEMTRFYGLVTPLLEGGKKDPLPIQYKPEKQPRWSELAYEICEQMASIDQTILERQERMYTLDKPIPQVQGNLEQPSTQLLLNTGREKQKTGLGARISSFFTGKKESSGTSPYDMERNNTKAKIQSMQDFYDYMEFHTTAPLYEEFYEHGLYDLLEIEKVEFYKRVAPITQLVGEGYNLIRKKEKEQGVNVVSSSLALTERHRQKEPLV